MPLSLQGIAVNYWADRQIATSTSDFERGLRLRRRTCCNRTSCEADIVMSSGIGRSMEAGTHSAGKKKGLATDPSVLLLPEE
jgi:hypothetical protein